MTFKSGDDDDDGWENKTKGIKDFCMDGTTTRAEAKR
jgi:hypothetical protein